MPKPFATIILAGGKGTRMGSSDRHKVCFEVLGVPVIIRALETYNLCGSTLNVVVVGMMAESVMATVNRRFPGTAYAFQERPLGTGDAARKGAGILERMGYEGNVLVVAGDKVIAARALRQLLAAHEHSGADVTLATHARPPQSSAGILLHTPRGNIVGILEEAERQRIAALGALAKSLDAKPSLSRSDAEGVILQHCGARAVQDLLLEIWPAGKDPKPLTGDEFKARFPSPTGAGFVNAGAELLPAHNLLERFNQMNLSTYLFRAPVLFDVLGRLKSSRPGGEEYLTDVFEILASRKAPRRVLGCEIQDAHDIMAFNNPQELLVVEEAYRLKEGLAPVESQLPGLTRLASPGQWMSLFERPSVAAQRLFRSWYGDQIPWNRFSESLEAFAARYGTNRNLAIVRSPGRINLLGRHIDHQGGHVNVMAINREIILVAAPRTDDTICLANSDGTHFSEQTFRISDLVASVNWDDWQRVVDGPRLARLLEAARGDWANYVKAAVLRLQEQFRDRRLRGLDIMVTGDIPMGAGLSSSSALVVASAEVTRVFNRLPVSAARLVSLCGEGEWFVGTRGGAADHAAIKLSKRGCVTRVGFFPFRIEDSARFYPTHDLVVCNSGIYAGKSREARNTFNAKVTAYHLGRVWCKLLRPDLAPRIQHLRDLSRQNLGLDHESFTRLLAQLPERISRRQVQAAFSQIAEAERDRLERLFLSHDAPAAGYAVREVVLFGLSEMARAQRCLDLLKSGDAEGLGKLMRISHDGDRVSKAGARGQRQRLNGQSARREFEAWAADRRNGDLADLSGSYACSLPALDAIVDIALELDGVAGAQLAGAGLGGCIMVLVRKTQTQSCVKALSDRGIKAEIFRPIAGACGLTLI